MNKKPWSIQSTAQQMGLFQLPNTSLSLLFVTNGTEKPPKRISCGRTKLFLLLKVCSKVGTFPPTPPNSPQANHCLLLVHPTRCPLEQHQRFQVSPSWWQMLPPLSLFVLTEGSRQVKSFLLLVFLLSLSLLLARQTWSRWKRGRTLFSLPYCLLLRVCKRQSQCTPKNSSWVAQWEVLLLNDSPWQQDCPRAVDAGEKHSTQLL